jgi:excisionase family DNA binding protein
MKNTPTVPSVPSAPSPVTPTPQSPANAPAAAAAASVDPGGHPNPMARDLLTVEQAAAHLQVSPSSIRSYIREGRLKAFRVAGLRKVLIPRAELLALLEPAHRTPPADLPADG